MKKEYYVILTGGKNNAGDFLIKYRAKLLFQHVRPDREIIDFNAWELLDDEKLRIVNQAKALILMGGPALQKHMYPGIYPLRKDLNDIKVPIVTMGIGWKSISGEWEDTYRYPLSKESLNLLRRVDESGYLSSVRDYHTLNVLHFKGFKNFVMTGCPAYYDLDFLNKPIQVSRLQKKVAFSLGVSFIESPSMEKLMKENILRCKEYFDGHTFEVVFHHSLDKNKFLSTHNASKKHVEAHNRFAQWLESKNIHYVDISGSAENLINHYSHCDLHIGYRVHAHIFMNSISKLSILISEDGRAKATKDVIGGIVLNGFTNFKKDLLSKVLNRLKLSQERYVANKALNEELLFTIQYEEFAKQIHLKNSRCTIDNNFHLMETFLRSLP